MVSRAFAQEPGQVAELIDELTASGGPGPWGASRDHLPAGGEGRSAFVVGHPRSSRVWLTVGVQFGA